MKKSLLAVMLLSVFVMTGCTSLQVASGKSMNGVTTTASGIPVAHITSTVSGWYLLSIPLITGSATDNNFFALEFGKDTCSVTSQVDRVTKEAKNQGGTAAVDMVSIQNSMSCFPIPLLFKIRTVTVSANAIR